MSSTLTQPQLTLSDRLDIYTVFDTVMHKLLITPNYLELEREITTPDFTFSMPGLDDVGIQMALVTLGVWKQAFPQLGTNPIYSDIRISPDGSSLSCLVDHFLTLAQPLTLPDGTSLTAVGHLYHLRSIHSITTRGERISSWRVSFDI